MSNYFFQRIKNIPITTNSNNSSPVKQQVKTPVKSDNDTTTLSDDELLASVLDFEQTPQFKKAEEESKKAKGL